MSYQKSNPVGVFFLFKGESPLRKLAFVRSVTLSTCVARRLALISPIDLCVRVHGELNLVRETQFPIEKGENKHQIELKGFFSLV